MAMYTSEKNIQIMIALLKKHGIKRVVASPGTTNLNFVASIQSDDWFEVYSSVDERSAAYIACGMADQTGEPVIITCTEATASRNYVSGLTEAYYRNLPVLAITGTRGNRNCGNLIPQSIDRSSVQNDICKISVEIPTVKDEDDKNYCELTINKALLELKRNGGGPVHINLCTAYTNLFDCQELPDARKIDRISVDSSFPKIPENIKIAIQIGVHKKFSEEEITAIEEFCEKYGAVVFYDHTSRYYGKHKVLFSLIGAQRELNKEPYKPDLTVYFGSVSGGNYPLAAKRQWIVNPDGEIRDRSNNVELVFEMPEMLFLKHYISEEYFVKNTAFEADLLNEYENLISAMPNLPFSNCKIAQVSSKLIPSNSNVYLGILNTLRTWNYFEVADDIDVVSNVGAFGIDGGISSAIGAALADRSKLNFAILGDLGFFYDLNALGNRHITENLRIMLINNGRGIEFRINDNIGSKFENEYADKYFAAAGHFGNKSKELVRQFSENLGFRYFSAENFDEFISAGKSFFSDKPSDKPMVFEVFVNQEDETLAHSVCRTVYQEKSLGRSIKNQIKKLIKH